MNSDPLAELAAHLDQREQSEATTAAARLAREKDQAAMISLMTSKLASRIKLEALPKLEEIASAMRDRGHHAAVILGEEVKAGPPPWIIALTLHLEYGPDNNPRSVADLHFLAEVDPGLDTWRVRSYVMSRSQAVRDAIPDVTFIPGISTVADFVTSRTVAFIKAAFPIPA